MAKYRLCLICSSNFYRPIIDTDFNSLKEIDKITEQFENEEEFRKDPKVAQRIKDIKNINDSYFKKISDPERRKGTIGVIDIDRETFTYVRPLFKENNALKSPKKLVSTITTVLKKENNGKFISKLFYMFRDIFNTEYTRISGIYSTKYFLEKVDEPITEREKDAYSHFYDLLKITLNHKLDKENDTMDDRNYYDLRRIYDYIRDSVHIKNLRVKNSKKNSSAKVNRKKSSEIVTEEILYRKLMEEAYKDSLDRGEEPNLLGIYDEKYKKELEKISWYYRGKR